MHALIRNYFHPEVIQRPKTNTHLFVKQGAPEAFIVSTEISPTNFKSCQMHIDISIDVTLIVHYHGHA